MIQRPKNPATAMSASTVRKYMRAYGWTIRSFAKAHDLTLKRVRTVCALGINRETVPRPRNPDTPYVETRRQYVRDWHQMLSGVDPWAGPRLAA